MKKNFILLTEKKWHLDLFNSLVDKNDDNWILINNKKDFNVDNLNNLKPNLIFIPHWSYIIPSTIYNNFECVVFHMTDLPYGRGGSPLQNLILRGVKKTKISALRVNKGMDTGNIYLKENLLLFGTAQEIFLRATDVILNMIEKIIKNNLRPKPQKGDVVEFKRRKPEDGNIENLTNIEKVYDYIRMLDADGYPNAFLKVGNLKFEFSRASIKNNKTIIADVKITEQ
ncbi:methionyl-tRNA formyltransferase [Polaribacter haliotis]|uniref:Methionyl-tRNA formyltransferase n=1 Tax=Polaribacter haliotis TaxID=1888915 RepID=A0A7L8AJA2_9FLAO|nr:formyltransferase family protein [Polaribacter haliotis]QOD62082.1 methionyl-tRNA formyltransferase [Polaribacter haliotis]